MDNLLVELLITVFFGPLGIHKFINKEVGWGIVYLFTGGLFGIGWFVDIVKVVIKMINSETQNNQPKSSNDFNQGQQRPHRQPQTNGQNQSQNMNQPNVYVEESRVKTTTCDYCGETNDIENKQCYNCGASLSNKH